MNLPRFSKSACTTVLLLVTALALPAAAKTMSPSKIDALRAQLVVARDVDTALGVRAQCYVDEGRILQARSSQLQQTAGDLHGEKQELSGKLSPSEINALRAQLVEARNVDTALDVKVQCYVDMNASLQALSSQLQQTAGDLHRGEQELSSKLAQTESEAEVFRRDFETISRKKANLDKDMHFTEIKIKLRKAALDDCKRKFGIINFMCDFAGEIVGLNGDLRNLSAVRNATGIKMRSLQQNLNNAESRYKQAAERFLETQSLSAENKRDITATDAEIKVIKQSLSEIHTVTQDYSTEFISFQHALTEFEGLNPSSDRRSVVRRLRRESADLDDLMAKTRGLLNENGLQLPSGKYICSN